MPSKFKKKKIRQRKRKEREGEKAKSESPKCCATFKPKNYVEILLSAHAELCKRLFRTWLKRPRSVKPGNGFVGRFQALKQHDSDQKTPQLASKRVFRPNL